jgi:hypothetical protein
MGFYQGFLTNLFFLSQDFLTKPHCPVAPRETNTNGKAQAKRKR